MYSNWTIRSARTAMEIRIATASNVRAARGARRSMRIAQVAPLCESVPPKLYGGTERVVSYLTEELVNLGHHVTLFASGDSLTSATLAASWPHALRLHGGAKDDLAPHILMLEQVAARA